MATENIRIVVSERGARRVSRNIAQIGVGAKAAGGSVQLLNRALGLLGGALVLVGTVRTLANFSQAMSTVKAITGATDEQFKALSDTAKELGATTRFTATQAGEGLIFLARTGFTAAESMAVVGSTLNLAQAGALDLGRAADIASNVLKGFRLRVDQAERVVDTLALTANSANTTVEQLGDALSFVAPAAAAVGIEVEQAAAAIGVLGDAGIPASRAGAGLRQVFIKLLSPTTRARNALRGMGLSVEDMDIQIRGLLPVLQSLSDANVGLSDAANLVGTRQASTLLVLIDSIKRMEELTEANKGAAGSAKRFATIMDDNLNGALLRVKSAFESIVLSLGEAGAEGTLRGAFERTAVLFRLVAANADILATGLAILSTVILAKLVKGAIVILISSITALGTAMLALSLRALPLLAAAGVAAFTALAIAAIASGKTIKEVFDDLMDAVTNVFSGLTEPVAVVNAFETKIGILSRSVEEAGGLAKMSKEQLEGFRDSVIELKDEVKGRLLLQQFLFPGSQAVIEMTDQVRVLDKALKSVAAAIEDSPGAPKVPKTDVPGEVAPKENQAFKDLLRDLEREGVLLKLSSAERAIRTEQFRAEDILGRVLTANELERVTALVATNTALDAQKSALDDIREPQTTYEEGLRVINELLENGSIKTLEASEAVRDLRIAFLETQTDLGAGVERAFLKMGKSADDFAAGAERTITKAFDSAADALTKFVMTGKLDFKSLATSIIADLARMAIKAFLVKAIFAAIGFFTSVPSSGGGGVIAPLMKASGGLVSGPGGPREDRVAALLSNGEFVVNALQTSKFLPLLKAINDNRLGQAITPSPGPSLRVGHGGGGGGGGGGGVVVQIFDQRTSPESQPVETKTGTGGDGKRFLQVIIRDTIKREITTGGMDSPMNQRFALKPGLLNRG